MKKLTVQTLKAITVSFVLAAGASAQEEVTWPAWQLVAAPADRPATVTWQVPADVDLESLTEVQVAGAAVSGMGIAFQDRLLEVQVEDAAADPLFISEVTLVYPDTDASLAVTPTEVHWPEGATDGGLQLRSQLSLGTSDHVLALLLENTAAVPVSVTDMRYAPASVSTGALLLATEFEPLDDLFDTSLPFFDPDSYVEGALPGSRTWDQEAWSGIPFDWFDFTDNELALESGQQAIVILGGTELAADTNLDTSQLFNFGPWFEYEQSGEPYWFQPFVSRTSLVQ